jgi:hypothetical protein
MNQWFYLAGAQQQVRLSEGELKDAFRSGRLAADTLVWTEGLASITDGPGLESSFGGKSWTEPWPAIRK